MVESDFTSAAHSCGVWTPLIVKHVAVPRRPQHARANSSRRQRRYRRNAAPTATVTIQERAIMIAAAIILTIVVGLYAFLRFMDGPRDPNDGEDWEDWT